MVHRSGQVRDQAAEARKGLPPGVRLSLPAQVGTGGINKMLEEARSGRRQLEDIVSRPINQNIILRKPALNQVSHIGNSAVRQAHQDAARADRLAQVGNSFMG